jgi:multidrug resistance efflux pump
MYDESQLKLEDLRRKKETIDAKIDENEALIRQAKQTYDNLMHFKTHLGV